MPVYVDPMVLHPRVRIGHAGPYWCHMIADTLDELHAIAVRAGLKREWFNPSPPASFPHYDIGTQRIRALAVKLGAIECDKYALVDHLRRIRSLRSCV